MAANLSALAPITTTATALSNLVLVSPQATQGYQPQNPQNADGTQSTAQPPPSLLFHYEGEQSVRLQSDITDHFVEDNTAVQNNISLKPIKITTKGFIGELNDITPSFLTILRAAADKLTVISAYTPVLSETALIAYTEAFLAYQVASNVVNSGVNAWSTINKTNGENVIGSSGLQVGAFNPATGVISNNQTKQQIMFQQFFGYWNSRTLFTVQTPWAVFQNMAVEEVTPVQDETTRMVTEFSVVFKMIRTAQSLTQIALGPAVILANRASEQASPLNNIGTTTPTQSIDLPTGLSQTGIA